MKCQNCQNEWSAVENTLICPYCGQDARLPAGEVDRLKTEGAQAMAAKNDKAAAAFYQDAAEQGDPESQFWFGRCLEEGRGVKKSLAKAVVYYKAAARGGYHEATWRLSLALSEMNLPRDVCGFWLTIAAAQGNEKAQWHLGQLYEQSTEQTAVNHLRSLYWYAQSAVGGYEDAAMQLVRYYTEDGTELSKAHARYFLPQIKKHRFLQSHYQRRLGRGESIPPKTDPALLAEELCAAGEQAEWQGENAIACTMYAMAADWGSAPAHCHLGQCAENGTGMQKDLSKAAVEYRAAAEAGYAPGMTRLGLLLWGSADGALQNSALSWLYKAADQGDADAEYALACALYDGKAVKRDLCAARKYFSLAAAHGNKDAAARSEEMEQVLDELCVRAKAAADAGDDRNAFQLYRIAAEMGHRGARCNAGYCYQTGKGVARNAKEAVRYYTLALEDGSLNAAYNLGVCYFTGDGVPCNYRHARLLFQKAAKAGYAGAEEYLKQMDDRKRKKIARKLYSISSIVYRRGETEKAIKLRMLAAKGGNLRAMYLLGCHYEFGDGLPYDHEAADTWYRRATDGGFQNGASRIKNGYLKERKRREIGRRR